MFNGGFQEALTGFATLPEDNGKAFEHFLGWLYRGTIDLTMDGAQLVDLYGFAEKYSLGELMDLTMDSFIEHLKTKNTILIGCNLDYIYENTHENSKLRLFGARCYTYVTVEARDEGCWETEKTLPRGLHKVEIMTDVFRQLRDFKNSPSRRPDGDAKLLLDPRTAPPCLYHVHASGVPCASKKNRTMEGEVRNDVEKEGECS
ncbi:hypothetical protein BKA64DRAFT_711883 [Cadophora sp. MPI-SDFR-AT-0126]|nr:hypothetical protein BKA64DRAFT_711883 [Leotiomycetes sp. MPI-SDFR-AT-0126]